MMTFKKLTTNDVTGESILAREQQAKALTFWPAWFTLEG